MPTGQQYGTNVPQTTLSAGITSGQTVFSVVSSSGWPSTPFTATLDLGQSNQEPVDVTNVSGVSWTVTRAIDGTAPFSHAANANVTHSIIGRDLRESRSHLDSAGPQDVTGKAVHGLTNTAGNVVVGTKEVQTLTNKTLLVNGATDWFNVKNPTYGAVGDGVANDTAAINAAITACVAANPTGGGVVYFPAGVYGVTPGVSTAAITLNNGSAGYNGVRLVGDSAQGSQLKKLGNGVLISMSGPASDPTGATHAKYCSIENLHLSGGGFTGQVIQAYYADNLYFQNLRIANNADVCIAGVEFWDSRFYNLVTEITGSLTANAATPVVLLQCAAAATGFGASTDTTNEIHFVGCRFEAFRTGAMWIQQGTGSTSGCSGIYLVDCKMETSAINGGPHLLVDANTRRAYIKNLYCFSGGFTAGYSTAQDIITWSAQDSSLVDAFFATNAVQTVANGVTLNSTVANQTSTAHNVTAIYNAAGLPTGAHLALGTATGGFRISDCNSNQTPITTLNPMELVIAPTISTNVLGSFVSGDTFKRWVMSPKGDQSFGDGGHLADVVVARSAPGVLGVTMGSMAVVTAGQGYQVKEGTNAKMGTAVLNGVTEVTVATTAVTATSRIQLTTNVPGGTVASPYVSSRVAGTSFGIKSTGASDTSTVAWLIIDPA